MISCIDFASPETNVCQLCFISICKKNRSQVRVWKISFKWYESVFSLWTHFFSLYVNWINAGEFSSKSEFVNSFNCLHFHQNSPAWELTLIFSGSNIHKNNQIRVLQIIEWFEKKANLRFVPFLNNCITRIFLFSFVFESTNNYRII